MNEIEAIEVLKNMDIGIRGTSECKKCIFSDEEDCFRDGKDCQMIAIETVLNLLEKKDKIINLMAKDIKEADKFLDSMGYLGEYEGYTIEGIIEEYNQEIEKGE